MYKPILISILKAQAEEENKSIGTATDQYPFETINIF